MSSVKFLKICGWYILRDWNLEDFDYKTILRNLQVKFGVTPFFKVTIIPNPRAPGNSSIAILPSGLGLPDRAYYYMQKDDSIITAYKQLIRDVVINLSAPKTRAEKFGNDIFFYEQRIAEITPESVDLQDPVHTYNPIKISELKLTIPTLPLQDILTALYPSAMIDDDTEVIVAYPDYLLKVSQIISSTDRATMNSYMIWTLVQKYLPYLSSPFTAAVDAFHAELYGTKKPLQRWEFCANLVQEIMPLAVNVMLEEQIQIDQSTRLHISSIFTQLQAVTKRRLKKFEHVPDLYSHLVKKLTALELQIGLPDEVKVDAYLKNHYNKLMVLKTNLFDSFKNGVNFLKKLEERRLMEANGEDYVVGKLIKKPFTVQYLPSNNAVLVPRAILTEPYFENDYPESVIYGRLGVQLAEAIVSSVLPYESAWAADKKLLTSFHLSVNESLRIVRYPTHCLSEFVSKNGYAVIDKANLTSLKSYKYLSALRVAYEAMKNELKDQPHVHQPSLEKFEDDALFYITQIQNLCTLTTPQQELYDNLVKFQLSENSMLKVAWIQDKLMGEALECYPSDASRCSDIF